MIFQTRHTTLQQPFPSIRDLKIRRQRLQRGRQKSNSFNNQNNSFAGITLFCSFLCLHCTTTTLYRGSLQATTKFPLYFWAWICSAVASMRPTEALASVKFWRISPIVFILHKRSSDIFNASWYYKEFSNSVNILLNQRLLGASSWMNWISVEKTVQ